MIPVNDALLDAIGQEFIAHPDGWMGPLFVGAVLDFFFIGVLCCQVRNYYSYFPKDQTWIKRLVAVVFCLSIAKGAISFSVPWDKVIVGFGDGRRAQAYSWGIWLEPAATAVISTVAQAFFVWRCFNMTGRNWYLLAGLMTIMLSSVGLAIALAIQFVYDPYNFPLVNAITAPMLITGVVVDVIITTIVARKLTQSLNEGFSTQTVNVLKRLLGITVESALPPALNQIINLVLYLTTYEKHLWHALFNMLTSRLYVFSLMHTLNARASIREQSSAGTLDLQSGWLRSSRAPGTQSAINGLALATFSKGDRPNGTLPVHVQTETIIHTSSIRGHRQSRDQNNSSRRNQEAQFDARPSIAEGNPSRKSEDGDSLDSSRWTNSDKVAKDRDLEAPPLT